MNAVRQVLARQIVDARLRRISPQQTAVLVDFRRPTLFPLTVKGIMLGRLPGLSKVSDEPTTKRAIVLASANGKGARFP